MAKLLANSGDADQVPSVASDLGLHCLLITLLGVSRLKWVKYVIPRGLFSNSLTVLFYCTLVQVLSDCMFGHYLLSCKFFLFLSVHRQK